MTNILSYISTFILVISLIGCQNDSPETTQNQSGLQSQPEQQGPTQQPGAMGQMQQSAPDVDLSDEEADVFTDAIMNAQKIQMQAQQKMVGIIQDEGLDVETYQKIAKASQMGQSPEESGASESDIEKFENANEAMEEVQKEIQDQIAQAVNDAGMEMERFQNINRAIQQDPELQKQIQEKMQEKMGSTGGMQQQQPPTGN